MEVEVVPGIINRLNPSFKSQTAERGILQSKLNSLDAQYNFNFVQRSSPSFVSSQPFLPGVTFHPVQVYNLRLQLGRFPALQERHLPCLRS